MTLDRVALDVPVRVLGFEDMRADDAIRLKGLGLRPGVALTKILLAPLRDPVECLVGSQLLAVEQRLLSRIRVEAA
jgi:Fe2+ transport system protein FeoA